MIEIFIGCLSGVITSLGMGGGTILIMLLNIFHKLDAHLIQGTNLLFFIPTAILASIMNKRNKLINFKYSKVIIISGVVGAIIGSLLTFKIDSKKIKVYFGIFLLFIALYEIYSLFLQYKNDKKNNTNKEENIKKFKYIKNKNGGE